MNKIQHLHNTNKMSKKIQTCQSNKKMKKKKRKMKTMTAQSNQPHLILKTLQVNYKNLPRRKKSKPTLATAKSLSLQSIAATLTS